MRSHRLFVLNFNLTAYITAVIFCKLSQAKNAEIKNIIYIFQTLTYVFFHFTAVNVHVGNNEIKYVRKMV